MHLFPSGFPAGSESHIGDGDLTPIHFPEATTRSKPFSHTVSLHMFHFHIYDTFTVRYMLT